MDDLELELNLFPPRDVAAVTGVSAGQQRNLRRRGYLPSVEGHSRANLCEMAQISALGMLSARGVDPHLAVEVSEIMAIGIAWWGLHQPEAYGGLPEDLDEAEDPELKALTEKAQALGYELPSWGWGWVQASDRLARRSFALMGQNRVIPARFFLWFPDGSHVWQDSADKCFNPGQHNVDGPVIVLDQLAVGKGLVARSPRPFVQITKWVAE